jgi:hypothetical protein
MLFASSAMAQDFAITKEDINVGKKQYSPYLHQRRRGSLISDSGRSEADISGMSAARRLCPH